MLDLEVIQSFPVQWSEFLSMIRVVGSSNSQVIMIDASNFKPLLPYHIMFHIQAVYNINNTFRMVVDEGTSTCVMSLSC